MSKAYQFPDDPNEPNPFAEKSDVPPAAGDNPYASPSGPAWQQQPGGYHMTTPHRGGLLLGLSITALVLGLLTLPLAFCCFPIAVLDLALSVPVLFMAREDLRGIRMGAVDSAGQGATQASLIMAIIATVIACASVLITVGRFFLLTMSNM